MSFESPISVLYNDEGYQVTVSESQAVVTTQPGLVIMGSGSSGWEYFKLDTNGALVVTGALNINELTASVNVDGWTPTVTASVNLVDWATDVTGSVYVVGPVFTTSSVTVDVWAANVTASVKLDQWSTNVTGAVYVVGPVFTTSSVTVDAWAANVTASVKIDQWTASVTASVREIGAANSTVSSTIAGPTSLTILSANASRAGALFYYTASAGNVGYLKFGTGASSTSFSVRLTNNAYFEVPENYTGAVSIADNATGTGTIYTTEYTY